MFMKLFLPSLEMLFEGAMEHMEFNETHIRETINAVLGLGVSSTTSNKKTKKERKPYVASSKVKAQQAFVKKHNKGAVRTETWKSWSHSLVSNSKEKQRSFGKMLKVSPLQKLSAATTLKCSQMWNSLSDEDKKMSLLKNLTHLPVMNHLQMFLIMKTISKK